MIVINVRGITFSVLGVLMLLSAVHAQRNKDSVKLARFSTMIEAKQYDFIAQTATPLSGSLRQLTSIYDLQINNDKIISDLPYFGRAYTAPYNPTDGGLHFTSSKFSYSATPGKKDRWDVSIRTEDQPDNHQIQLTIFSNGTATLQVLSNNRQSISFTGYVKELKKKD